MTCTRLGRTGGTEDEICGDNAESKIRETSIITQSGAAAARLAHTQKATGASPVSATNCARLYGSLAHKGVIR